MSNTTLTFRAKINGALIDVDEITFTDQNEDFGVRRRDTLDVVVASGTALTRSSVGIYTYTFTNPEPGLQYEYTVKVVYNDTSYYFNRLTNSPSVNALISIPTYDHYTSQAEVYRIAGEYAIELMNDDYSGEDKGYMWDNMLEDVDDTMKMYLMQHYDPDTLYQVTWVRRRASWLVANLLSMRRGNNPLWPSKVEKIYEELMFIRDGKFRIPGATIRHWQGPNVRNYQMQNRFLSKPVRVIADKSTGNHYPGEDLGLVPFFFCRG